MIPIDYIVFRPPNPPSYLPPIGDDYTNVVNEDLKSTFYITPDCIQNFDPFDNFLNDSKEESQRLSAFHCVYPGAKTTILYSHGNAEDIGQLKKWMIYLSRYLKCNTVAYDYQGYGCSNNTPTEKHFFSDIRLAFKFLTDCRSIPSEDIIIYGRSIGSGPTTDLLKECVEKRIKLKGVVLQSPLLSAVKTKFNAFTVPDFFITDMMKNEEKLTSVCNFSFLKSIPILIFHGRKDVVVPYEHGYTLFKIASSKLNPNEKSCSRFVSLPDAGHNNCESLYFEDMMYEIKKFMLDRNEEVLANEGSVVEKQSIAAAAEAQQSNSNN